MGFTTVLLLAAAFQTVCWHGADAAATVSGDLVFKKDYTGPGNSQRTKLFMVSPRGVNRGSIVLPHLPKQRYTGLAVTGKYAFLTSYPDSNQPKIVGLKLVVVDLSRSQPKVTATLELPVGNLAGPNEACGGSSSGQYAGVGGDVVARLATGTGSGSYRIAVSVACFNTKALTDRRCLSKSVMQVFTYNPTTQTLKRTPPAYNLATGSIATEVFGSGSEPIQSCQTQGAAIISDAKWLAGSIFVFSDNSFKNTRELYKLTASRPASLLATYRGYGQNNEFCNTFVVASPTSVYASCLNPSSGAQQVTEKFKNNKLRLVGQALRSSRLSVSALATTGKGSTPIYVGVEDSTVGTYKVFSIGKTSKGPLQPAFTPRYALGFNPRVQVVG